MQPLIDLTGKTFGRLTVIERAGSNTSGNPLWKCQCSCPANSIVYITGSSLRSGGTQSCGCLHREIVSKRNTKDLTGTVFGKLTAIKRVGTDEYRNAVWECKCDCGNICYVSSHSLLSHLTRSCGCLHKEVINKMNSVDLTGRRFDKLVALRQTEQRSSARYVMWECKCDCGNIVVVSSRALISGNTKSCGCLKVQTNSERLTKWYTDEEKDLSSRFSNIKQRCYNPHDTNYKDYGGRGIYVCDEWLKDTRLFVEWSLNNGFKKELTINRIDNDGPYAPWNCEWTDFTHQANNRRTNINVEINGEMHTIADWARLSGINYSKLHHTLQRGYQLFKDVVLYNLTKQPIVK